MDTFVFLKVLSQLLMPPASMALGLLVGLLLAAIRLRRLGALVALFSIIELLVLSLPPVADALLEPLQREARAAAGRAPACCYDAIVVLGGGMTPAAPPEVLEPGLSEAADRVWYAAQLFHRHLAPRIIVSGGNFMADGPAATEAEAMRRFLLDLGVPGDAIVSEKASLNTIENVRNVRLLVGDGRVALVTSGYHMPRALAIARSGHLSVGAFPTDWRLPQRARPFWENWIPSIDAMAWSCTSLREHIALLLDRRGV